MKVKEAFVVNDFLLFGNKPLFIHPNTFHWTFLNECCPIRPQHRSAKIPSFKTTYSPKADSTKNIFEAGPQSPSKEIPLIWFRVSCELVFGGCSKSVNSLPLWMKTQLSSGTHLTGYKYSNESNCNNAWTHTLKKSFTDLFKSKSGLHLRVTWN